MISIYLQSFMLISLIISEKCSGQSSKCQNEQRALTPKLGKTECYGSCALQTYSIRYIYLQSFMLITLIFLELCPGQSSKYTNKQRAIIQTLGNAELRFLCSANLLNKIYLPTRFYVDISYSLSVMSRTKFKV
jgi:hypothetical protein